jgi:hypothetical protein
LDVDHFQAPARTGSADRYARPFPARAVFTRPTQHIFDLVFGHAVVMDVRLSVGI